MAKEVLCSYEELEFGLYLVGKVYKPDLGEEKLSSVFPVLMFLNC